MHTFFVFGDSITYGAWDIAEGGWAQRLRNYMDSVHDHRSHFFSLGIPGETTAGLLERFEHEVAVRMRDDSEYTVVFAYGANDVARYRETLTQVTSPTDFAHNIKAMITLARQYTDSIYFVDITPVDEDSLATRTHSSKVRSNSDIHEYNKLLYGTAEANGAIVISVHQSFEEHQNKPLFSYDGLHPNEDGHQLIFEQVKDALRPSIET
jgi:lysophospholipase L1-like esterase